MNAQAAHSAFDGAGAAGGAGGEDVRNLQMRLDEALRCIERLEASVSLLEEKLLEHDWRYPHGSFGS